MKGGDTVPVKRVFATPKARAVLEGLAPGTRIEELFPEGRDRITLMADDSPFFIHETGPYRVVLCVAHDSTVEDGVFAVVNVQLRKRK